MKFLLNGICAFHERDKLKVCHFFQVSWNLWPKEVLVLLESGTFSMHTICCACYFKAIIEHVWSYWTCWTQPRTKLIFLHNFILIWKYQKWSLNRGTFAPATAIYQTKCLFTVPSALFIFFQMLPYDSRLFPAEGNFM